MLVFDELVRHDKILAQSCEEQFLKFVENTAQMAKQKQDIASENIRLNTELIKSNQDIRTLEEKLKEWLVLLDYYIHIKNIGFGLVKDFNLLKFYDKHLFKIYKRKNSLKIGYLSKISNQAKNYVIGQLL